MLRPVRGKHLPTRRFYTFDEILDRCSGQPWWNCWSQAHDEARYEIKWFAKDGGDEDPEEDECPDEACKWYAEENDLLFDEDGHIWTRW